MHSQYSLLKNTWSESNPQNIVFQQLATPSATYATPANRSTKETFILNPIVTQFAQQFPIRKDNINAEFKNESFNFNPIVTQFMQQNPIQRDDINAEFNNEEVKNLANTINDKINEETRFGA